MKDVPPREQPISERYRIEARKYCALNAAATSLEEMKTSRLATLKTQLMAADGAMAENKAERLVKSSDDWHAYIKAMCDARAAAELSREELAALRMQFGEWQAADASARAEYKLGRAGP